MVCYDFIFDGEKLSDYNYIMCSINNGDVSWSGSDVTFTTIKPPSNNRISKTNSKFDEQLTTTVQIMKNPCFYNNQNDMNLTADDQSAMMRWLQRTDGYHWLSFDQEWYEDIWYNAQINPRVLYVEGHAIGFELVITTDSPYAYSQEHKEQFSLKPYEEFKLYDYSDLPGHIFPKTTIKITKVAGNSQMYLLTGCDEDIAVTTVENTYLNQVIVLDEENDYVEGIPNLNNFNFHYPKISNSYNNILNIIKNRGDVDIDVTFEYRYIRRVVV